MFMKHPLDIAKDKLSSSDVVDAIRLAIVAELDAISFYLQIARRVDDEAVRKVFKDIAREEETHVGEFLALLKRLDPEQARELEKGFREVSELLGETVSEG
jgi:rubrerythrin